MLKTFSIYVLGNTNQAIECNMIVPVVLYSGKESLDTAIAHQAPEF